MGNHHHGHHGPAAHATAATPTLSLLRLSAVERLIGSGVVLGALWGLVLLVLG
ncbi:MAG TPA: hypothetical protein VHK66_08255 [Microvirga sp.]|jgi:hypothetical protein|nr:hypothetical protein [Microvirga sp.]